MRSLEEPKPGENRSLAEDDKISDNKAQGQKNSITQIENNRPESQQISQLQEAANDQPQYKQLSQLQKNADRHVEKERLPIQQMKETPENEVIQGVFWGASNYEPDQAIFKDDMINQLPPHSIDIKNFKEDSAEFQDFSEWFGSLPYTIEEKYAANQTDIEGYFLNFFHSSDDRATGKASREIESKTKVVQDQKPNFTTEDKEHFFDLATSIQTEYAEFLDMGEGDLAERPNFWGLISGVEHKKPDDLPLTEVQNRKDKIHAASELKNSGYTLLKYTDDNYDSTDFKNSNKDFLEKMESAVIGNVQVLYNEINKIYSGIDTRFLFEFKPKLNQIDTILEEAKTELRTIRQVIDHCNSKNETLPAYFKGFVRSPKGVHETIKTNTESAYNSQHEKLSRLVKEAPRTQNLVQAISDKNQDLIAQANKALGIRPRLELGNMGGGFKQAGDNTKAKISFSYNPKKEGAHGLRQEFKTLEAMYIYFLKRWIKVRSHDYKVDDQVDTETITYHNGVNPEEIMAAKDGKLKLQILAQGALKSNTKVRRPAFLINRIGHVHLQSGSWGMAFCYEQQKDGKLAPHVIDFADSRKGNEYNWKTGTGFNPPVPAALSSSIASG